MNWMTTILAFGGSLVGLWATIRYIVLVTVRVDKNTFRTIYELSKSERKIVISEEFFTEGRHPVLFVALCLFEHSPIFYISHSERLLQAGWIGKDNISNITCLRWKYKHLREFLSNKLKSLQLDRFGVPVEIATPYYIDKIGSIKHSYRPLQNESVWKDIDQEVKEVVDEKRKKTGAILYGPPGNGKTSFVKYLATKYRLPIKIITFNPEFNNTDIMFMFSQITPKSLVLMEDFDNYFDGRKCLIGQSSSGTNNMGIKFTFDIILNCLDGVYNTYEGVVFIMTANDVEKIDYALMNRPSRFKYVRKFDNPGKSIANKLIGDWSDHIDKLNLDQLIRLKEYKESGINFKNAMKKLNLKGADLEKAAYNRYLERASRGEDGSPEEDWYYALNNGVET